MEGSTEHWTTAKKPLVGALRVDGKVYRFLGKDQVALIPIAPMTNVERWRLHILIVTSKWMARIPV